MSPPLSFSHFVFVDFENVPSVDLAPIEGKPVHVTLLIGEKQKRLTLALVRQIHRHATQVTLVEVGASGRNALDLVLAAHLGRATVQHPEADFTIVSKDRDFDPLIAHLRANHVRLVRHPDFFEAPAVGAAKRPVPSAPRPAPAKHPAERRVPAPRDEVAVPPPLDKMEKLIARLQSSFGPRPKRKDRLLHHINTSFGNQLSVAEVSALADELVRRGIVTIDANAKLSYR